jgi:DNA-binding NtrC family response regulator
MPVVPPSSIRPHSARPRALVADDDRMIRSLVRRALVGANFEVLDADNGKTALDLLRAAQFDLLVTDVQMPIMDGLDLLWHSKVERPHMPVVLMSGHYALAQGQMATDLGAFALIRKPFSAEQIQRAARHAIELRSVRQA